MDVIYFQRNKKAGFSINKVTQTIIRNIPQKKEFYVPFWGGSLRVLIGNIIYVWKHRNRHAINHITGDIHYCILALIGCRSVLTIHDTVTLDFCDLPKWKKCLIEWLWYRLPLKLATKVVCISEETRCHIQKYTRRTDIEVIHNAIDPIFVQTPKEKSEDVPNILLIGTSPNKNLLRTFEALEGMNCKVTIIGTLNEEQLNALAKYKIYYINKVGLSDEQLIKEYVNCDIVSFISLFEGFGMIIIEANKIGRPVICSDIPVLKEIAGDAALFVNPYDVSQMKREFEQLITNKALQYKLIMAGEKNVMRFDASLILKQWETLYSSIG